LIFNLFGRKPPALRSVLFVCTANITRSPAAAALFRQLATKAGEEWEVASAGTNAVKGAPSLPELKIELGYRKIFIPDHKSQPVTKSLIANYRWIMVMERKHHDFILKLDPTAGNRTFVLRDFGVAVPLENPDFPDPTYDSKGRKNKELNPYDMFIELLIEEVPRIFELLRERVVNYQMGSEDD